MCSVALLLIVGPAAAAGNPLEHEMLIKVQATRADLPALLSAGLYLNEVGPDFVRGSILPSKAPALGAKGFRYEILIPDIVKYAEEMTTPSGGFGVYHTYTQMRDSMAVMAINNPGICRLETLGASQSGNLVLALLITQNPAQENHRPRILWDGTTHGNENIGTEACWYFLQQLIGQYGTDPLITRLVNTREIWVVPCVNPDGLISRSRYNNNGIDLNRENGYGWDNASGANEPFTQGEIQAMRRLFQRKHFTLDVTYHSGATVAMWVWGWTDQQPRDVGIMSDQVTRYANTCGYDYGMISQVMYFAPGGSTDYYYGCEGALGYAAEISSGQPPPANQIDTIAHANWTASRDLMVRGAWGMRGQITDSLTGQPVKKALVVTTPSSWFTYTDTCGWYFRCAYSGTYSVKVMADGYVTKTVSGVTVPTDSWTVANIALVPDTTAPITGYKLTWWICPNYSQAGTQEGLSMLFRHDGTSLTLTNRGSAVIEMSAPIINGPGTDFTVYSTGSKACSVYVSDDSFNGPWHFCSYGTGNRSCDLATAGVALARYVRLGDGGSGYDLDAIEGVIVNAPALTLNNLRIIDSTGNSNGRLDPGETAQLVVALRNAGRLPASAVTGNLHSWSSYVTVNDSTGTFGDILPDSVRENNADRFDVTASGATPRGTPCDFTLHLHGTGYSDSIRLTIVVGQLTTADPIPDGPRTPPLYYAYDDIDAAYPPHPTYNWSEINAVGTRLSFSQNDVVLLENLPTAFGPLKFYGQRYTQISVSADGWICPGNYTTPAYSNTSLPNSGTPPGMICANWDDLDPAPDGSGYIYMYHDVANRRLVLEWDSVAYWSPNTVRDKFEVIFYDTTTAAPSGDNAIVVQYMTANGFSSSTLGIEDPSWTIAIQDLYNGAYHQAAAPIQAGRAIEYTTIASSSLEQGNYRRLEPLGLAAFPNPLTRNGKVQFSLPEAGRVSLKLYSTDGRLVSTLLNQRMNAGTHYVPVCSPNSLFGIAHGVYVLKLETDSGALASKLVMLD
jgi:hypothetical protein